MDIFRLPDCDFTNLPHEQLQRKGLKRGAVRPRESIHLHQKRAMLDEAENKAAGKTVKPPRCGKSREVLKVANCQASLAHV
jgi:predicted secreted Zn-dependent protease